MKSIPTFDAKLISARALAPGVRELVFERADGEPLDFIAGQWLKLVLPTEGGELRRAYSIASAPKGDARFELAVTHVDDGPGSGYLHALEPGATLTAIGPQGVFYRPPDRKGPVLFVGTGTGVTPLRSMLVDAVHKNEQGTFWLLFGARHPEDILYKEEFEALTKDHPNVRVFVTLSKPDEKWKGRTGYVQSHVQELWRELEALGEGGPHAYICGRKVMVDAVRKLLKESMSIPRQQIHSERYD